MPVRPRNQMQLARRSADAGADKRERIIQTAISLFIELGYDNVRINDITDSAGIGKGTFYLYFENKQELLYACFKKLEDKVSAHESGDSMRNGDFFSRMRLRVSARLESSPSQLLALVHTMVAAPDPDIAAAAQKSYRAIIDPLKQDLLEAMNTGIAREVDAELAAHAWVGMADNLLWRASLDAAYSTDEAVGALLDFAEHASRVSSAASVPAPTLGDLLSPM